MRWLALAVLTAFAVPAAIAGTFVHAATLNVGVIQIPFGLGVALGGLGSVMMLAHHVAETRVGKIPVAVAWLLPTWVLAQDRPGGDVVIANGWTGLTFLFGTVVLVGVVLGLPPR